MEGENYIDNSNCKEMDTNCRMTLRKGEKLRHRSLVENLFRKGDSLYEFPIRLTWQTMDNDEFWRIRFVIMSPTEST